MNRNKQIERKPFKPREGKPWKGFAVRKAMKSKPDPKLTAWSKEVRGRDNHTCQKPDCEFCHNVEGMGTVAHHVCQRSQRPDLRLDRANGLTLCKQAHHWIHFVDPKAAREQGLLSTETYEYAMAKERDALVTRVTELNTLLTAEGAERQLAGERAETHLRRACGQIDAMLAKVREMRDEYDYIALGLNESGEDIKVTYEENSAHTANEILAALESIATGDVAKGENDAK